LETPQAFATMVMEVPVKPCRAKRLAAFFSICRRFSS
jgi:hypothetical protein